MIWLLLTKPVLVGLCAAAVIALTILADVLLVWQRLGRVRQAFPLPRLLTRRWAQRWPLVFLAGLFTWSLAVVVGLATLVGEHLQ